LVKDATRHTPALHAVACRYLLHLWEGAQYGVTQPFRRAAANAELLLDIDQAKTDT
jgi:hypothetical protein